LKRSGRGARLVFIQKAADPHGQIVDGEGFADKVAAGLQDVLKGRTVLA
jgi:hypothetical protein